MSQGDPFGYTCLYAINGVEPQLPRKDQMETSTPILQFYFYFAVGLQRLAHAQCSGPKGVLY